MHLRKSKAVFLTSLLVPASYIFGVLLLMKKEGFLLIPSSLEATSSLPFIYFSCVALIICIGYMMAGFVLDFYRLPSDLNVDFEKKTVSTEENNVLTSNFIKTKVVSYSRASTAYTIDFYSLKQRKFLIKRMYKSNLSIQELIDQHSNDGVVYLSPYHYFIQSFWK